MSRTTKDLIDELRREAVGASFCVLAIGFETKTELISSSRSDRDAMDDLNKWVEAGGRPLGFVRATVTRGGGGQVELQARVLSDHKGEAAAISARVLKELQAKLLADMQKESGGGLTENLGQNN